MKRKVILVALSIMIMCYTLTGCNLNGRVDNPPASANITRFITTGNQYVIDGLAWTEYVDTDTDNLYLCCAFSDGSSRAGISPVYDEDGNIAKYTK